MSTPLITDVPGMTSHMGRLFSMMTYVRSTTIASVDGLRVADLDHLHDAGSNSIGALLLHIGAVEKVFQCRSFWGREFDEQERAEWGEWVSTARSRLRKRGGKWNPELIGDFKG